MDKKEFENREIQMNHLAQMSNGATASTRTIVVCVEEFEPGTFRASVGVAGTFSNNENPLGDVVYDLARCIKSITNDKVEVKIAFDDHEIEMDSVSTIGIALRSEHVPRT